MARRQQLSKLRELALVLAADVVDRQLEDTWNGKAFNSTSALRNG